MAFNWFYKHVRLKGNYLVAQAMTLKATGETTWLAFMNKLKKNLANKIFGYLARCEGKLGYIDPKKLKFWVEIGSKCRNRLCQNLKFRVFQNLSFGEMKNLDTKTKILKSCKEFGFPKNRKSEFPNLKFDFDFEFWGHEFDF